MGKMNDGQGIEVDVYAGDVTALPAERSSFLRAELRRLSLRWGLSENQASSTPSLPQRPKWTNEMGKRPPPSFAQAIQNSCHTTSRPGIWERQGTLALSWNNRL
ncbi:hypothetical protein Trco_008287 [Trichoderma cornu-damae]|uniref:Uncharacterized protein n=1 Tax=Trichoderma cornu-damae TaxID=654480 RepID=A0A9P8QJ35_9HYPO|nr:hypothetical protein Trco_008287 [Trichoderma cornu-damae]